MRPQRDDPATAGVAAFLIVAGFLAMLLIVLWPD